MSLVVRTTFASGYASISSWANSTHGVSVTAWAEQHEFQGRSACSNRSEGSADLTVAEQLVPLLFAESSLASVASVECTSPHLNVSRILSQDVGHVVDIRVSKVKERLFHCCARCFSGNLENSGNLGVKRLTGCPSLGKTQDENLHRYDSSAFGSVDVGEYWSASFFGFHGHVQWLIVGATIHVLANDSTVISQWGSALTYTRSLRG